MQHVKRIEELLENRSTFTKCTLASFIDEIALPFSSIDVDEENIGEVLRLALPNIDSKVGRCLIQEVLPNRMTPSSSVDDVQLIVNDGDVVDDSCSILSFDSISSLPISEEDISDGCLIQELFPCRNISITSFGIDNIANDVVVEIKPANLDQIDAEQECMKTKSKSSVKEFLPREEHPPSLYPLVFINPSAGEFERIDSIYDEPKRLAPRKNLFNSEQNANPFQIEVIESTVVTRRRKNIFKMWFHRIQKKSRNKLTAFYFCVACRRHISTHPFYSISIMQFGQFPSTLGCCMKQLPVIGR